MGKRIKIWKDSLKEGTWITTRGQVFHCGPEDLRHFHDRTKSMLACGTPLPVCWEHQHDDQEGDHELSASDLHARWARNTAGHIHDVRLTPNGLEMLLDVDDQVRSPLDGKTDRERLESLKFVSPDIRFKWRDRNGPARDEVGPYWPGQSIAHLALTPLPVQTTQAPFNFDQAVSLSAAGCNVALSSARLLTEDVALGWNAEKHPRGKPKNKGQFAPKGGGGGGAKKDKKAAAPDGGGTAKKEPTKAEVAKAASIQALRAADRQGRIWSEGELHGDDLDRLEDYGKRAAKAAHENKHGHAMYYHRKAAEIGGPFSHLHVQAKEHHEAALAAEQKKSLSSDAENAAMMAGELMDHPGGFSHEEMASLAKKIGRLKKDEINRLADALMKSDHPISVGRSTKKAMAETMIAHLRAIRDAANGKAEQVPVNKIAEMPAAAFDLTAPQMPPEMMPTRGERSGRESVREAEDPNLNETEATPSEIEEYRKDMGEKAGTWKSSDEVHDSDLNWPASRWKKIKYRDWLEADDDELVAKSMPPKVAQAAETHADHAVTQFAAKAYDFAKAAGFKVANEVTSGILKTTGMMVLGTAGIGAAAVGVGLTGGVVAGIGSGALLPALVFAPDAVGSVLAAPWIVAGKCFEKSVDIAKTDWTPFGKQKSKRDDEGYEDDVPLSGFLLSGASGQIDPEQVRQLVMQFWSDANASWQRVFTKLNLAAEYKPLWNGGMQALLTALESKQAKKPKADVMLSGNWGPEQERMHPRGEGGRFTFAKGSHVGSIIEQGVKSGKLKKTSAEAFEQHFAKAEQHGLLTPEHVKDITDKLHAAMQKEKAGGDVQKIIAEHLAPMNRAHKEKTERQQPPVKIDLAKVDQKAFDVASPEAQQHNHATADAIEEASDEIAKSMPPEMKGAADEVAEKVYDRLLERTAAVLANEAGSTARRGISGLAGVAGNAAVGLGKKAMNEFVTGNLSYRVGSDIAVAVLSVLGTGVGLTAGVSGGILKGAQKAMDWTTTNKNNEVFDYYEDAKQATYESIERMKKWYPEGPQHNQQNQGKKNKQQNQQHQQQNHQHQQHQGKWRPGDKWQHRIVVNEHHETGKPQFKVFNVNGVVRGRAQGWKSYLASLPFRATSYPLLYIAGKCLKKVWGTGVPLWNGKGGLIRTPLSAADADDCSYCPSPAQVRKLAEEFWEEVLTEWLAACKEHGWDQDAQLSASDPILGGPEPAAPEVYTGDVVLSFGQMTHGHDVSNEARLPAGAKGGGEFTKGNSAGGKPKGQKKSLTPEQQAKRDEHNQRQQQQQQKAAAAKGTGPTPGQKSHAQNQFQQMTPEQIMAHAQKFHEDYHEGAKALLYGKINEAAQNGQAGSESEPAAEAKPAKGVKGVVGKVKGVIGKVAAHPVVGAASKLASATQAMSQPGVKEAHTFYEHMLHHLESRVGPENAQKIKHAATLISHGIWLASAAAAAASPPPAAEHFAQLGQTSGAIMSAGTLLPFVFAAELHHQTKNLGGYAAAGKVASAVGKGAKKLASARTVVLGAADAPQQLSHGQIKWYAQWLVDTLQKHIGQKVKFTPEQAQAVSQELLRRRKRQGVQMSAIDPVISGQEEPGIDDTLADGDILLSGKPHDVSKESRDKGGKWTKGGNPGTRPGTKPGGDKPARTGEFAKDKSVPSGTTDKSSVPSESPSTRSAFLKLALDASKKAYASGLASDHSDAAQKHLEVSKMLVRHAALVMRVSALTKLASIASIASKIRGGDGDAKAEADAKAADGDIKDANRLMDASSEHTAIFYDHLAIANPAKAQYYKSKAAMLRKKESISLSAAKLAEEMSLALSGKDAKGHLHKDKGPGGGQFTSAGDSGVGGKSAAGKKEPTKAEIARAASIKAVYGADKDQGELTDSEVSRQDWFGGQALKAADQGKHGHAMYYHRKAAEIGGPFSHLHVQAKEHHEAALAAEQKKKTLGSLEGQQALWKEVAQNPDKIGKIANKLARMPKEQVVQIAKAILGGRELKQPTTKKNLVNKLVENLHALKAAAEGKTDAAPIDVNAVAKAHPEIFKISPDDEFDIPDAWAGRELTAEDVRGLPKINKPAKSEPVSLPENIQGFLDHDDDKPEPKENPAGPLPSAQGHTHGFKLPHSWNGGATPGALLERLGSYKEALANMPPKVAKAAEQHADLAVDAFAKKLSSGVAYGVKFPFRAAAGIMMATASAGLAAMSVTAAGAGVVAGVGSTGSYIAGRIGEEAINQGTSHPMFGHNDMLHPMTAGLSWTARALFGAAKALAQGSHMVAEKALAMSASDGDSGADISPEQVKKIAQQFWNDAQRSWKATIDKHNLTDEYKQQWNPNMQVLLDALEEGQRRQSKPKDVKMSGIDHPVNVATFEAKASGALADKATEHACETFTIDSHLEAAAYHETAYEQHQRAAKMHAQQGDQSAARSLLQKADEHHLAMVSHREQSKMFKPADPVLHGTTVDDYISADSPADPVLSGTGQEG